MKYIVYNKKVYELTESIYGELVQRKQEKEIAQANEGDDPFYAECEVSNYWNMLEWIARSCPEVSTDSDNYDLYRYDQRVITDKEELPF